MSLIIFRLHAAQKDKRHLQRFLKSKVPKLHIASFELVSIFSQTSCMGLKTEQPEPTQDTKSVDNIFTPSHDCSLIHIHLFYSPSD